MEINQQIHAKVSFHVQQYVYLYPTMSVRTLVVCLVVYNIFLFLNLKLFSV